MDDLGKGVGKDIGNLGSCAVALSVLVVISAVLVLSVPVLAADQQLISVVKGDQFRMADSKMADRITRLADPAGDQARLDGTPEPDAPKWSDIESVYVTPTRTPPKLLTKMNNDHPPGTAESLYGDIEPAYGDRLVFVAVKMAKKLPAGSRGQQVEVGFSGDAATPVQNGTHLTTWAGTETFTLAGLFSNGAHAVAATDVGGRQPGLELEVDEYYDAESGAYGFYRPKNATWYLVLPRADDTAAVTVSVRSSTDVGSVIDRLDLPGGGHFIKLGDPAGGYRPKSELSPLTCRSLETFNGESGTIETLEIDSNLIRYSAGLEPTADAAEAAELLAPAVEAAGPVSVALSAVGSENEPTIVQGDLAVDPSGTTVSLSFEAPAGQWTFALVDELELTTPAGEPIIDHMTLTGPAGVQVGPGLDGYVAGGRDCTITGVEELVEAAEEVEAGDA